MTSYKALFFSLGLLGCGASAPGNAWQAAWPISLSVATGGSIEPMHATRALTEGAQQLGFQVLTQGWGQWLAVVYDADCRCRTCSSGQTQHIETTAAYVSQADYRTIYVCPAYARVVRDLGSEKAADAVLKHELGHVFGFVGHLPQGEGVLMSGSVDERPTVRTFGADDVAAICSAGGINSPICP